MSRHSIQEDKLRKTADISDQCDPCLYRERLIRVHPESIENIIYGSAMSGHDFQIEVGGAGRQ